MHTRFPLKTCCEWGRHKHTRRDATFYLEKLLGKQGSNSPKECLLDFVCESADIVVICVYLHTQGCGAEAFGI